VDVVCEVVRWAKAVSEYLEVCERLFSAAVAAMAAAAAAAAMAAVVR